MKLRKGDKVKIIAGKDRGKEGVIDRIFSRDDRVAVNGVNVYKRHLKPRGEGQKGEIKDISRPLPVSNISLICPKCHQTTRIGYKIITQETTKGRSGQDRKTRVCKKCEQEI